MWKWLTMGFALAAWIVSAGEIVPAPGATETDGVMRFKSGGHAVVKGGETLGAAGRGVTISAAVRLPAAPKITGSGFAPDKSIICHYDIIASKGGDFVFGRRNDAWVDQPYFNFRSGGKWMVPLKKMTATPPSGQWAVWTLTLRPVVRKEEGRSYTIATIYLNGEPEFRLEVDGIPDVSGAQVLLGKGMGIKNEEWGCRGEIAEAEVFDRALSDDEVLALAGRSRLAKVTAKVAVAVSPELDAALKKMTDRTASAALRRAAALGFDQKVLLAEASDRTAALKKEPLASGFALIWTGKGKGASPVFGLFDAAGRDVFGRGTLTWSLAGFRSGKKFSAGSGAPWECVGIGPGRYRVSWQLASQVRAVSVITLKGNRLTCDFAVENADPSLRIESADFPKVRLARMAAEDSVLVHPRQSGILYRAPAVGSLPESAWYPSGWVNMQFNAVYDSRGGVYISPEDPEAHIRLNTLRGRSEDLEITWSNPVAYSSSASGAGNGVRLPAAAVELFTGDWYDATQIYGRFASEASWSKPKIRPTPEWFRDNTLWFAHWTFKKSDFTAMPKIMKTLRDYFELPFGVHWYRWYDSGLPHMLAKPGTDEVNAELAKIGVYIKPYIDNRLWSELDGPGRNSDMEYSRIGKKYAVRNADGTINTERYSAKCLDVVMCPGAEGWQIKMTDVVRSVAAHGFKMVYHDQVSASRPFVCFDPNHGHLRNDPAMWGRGYGRMFDRIAGLNLEFPWLCHDTEDAADAHMRWFDGFMPWRWTDDGQIPLFVAVYGGRTQFTGRVYDQTVRGDADSFEVKAALQFVQNEQIGWFTSAMLLKHPRHPAFIKKLIHLRKALLPYFIGGKMLRPLRFDVPVRTLLWGVPSGSKPRPVTTPVVLHNVWRGPDGWTVTVFVHVGPDPVTVAPALPSGTFICREDGSVAAGTKKLTLSPLEVAIATDAPDSEAKRIAAELSRAGKFTSAGLFAAFGTLTPQEDAASRMDFSAATGRGVSGKGDAVMIQGDGEKNLQYKIPFLLEPEREYTLTLRLKKSAGGVGYFAIANYSAGGKLKFYAVNGAKVPADGQWHPVTVTFRTDAALHNCGMFLYNVKSKGTISADKLVLRQNKGGGNEHEKTSAGVRRTRRLVCSNR